MSERHSIDGVRIAPLVFYEIESRCNLTCTHCLDSFGRTGFPRLSAAAVGAFHRRLSSVFEGANNLDAVITGGEPTLHPDLGRMVSVLATYGHVTVTTNGTTNRARRLIPLLKKVSGLSVQVSLDGAHRESHDSIRGSGTFDKIKAFIDAVCSAGMGSRLTLSMTVTQANVAEVDEVIQLAGRRGIGAVHFPALLPAGRSRAAWREICLQPEQQIALEERLGTLMSRPDPPRISCNAIEQVVARALDGPLADCLEKVTLKVDADGRILPCPATGRIDAALGHIEDAEIVELLPKKIKFARRLWRDGRSNGPSCSGCAIQRECGTICAACPLIGPALPEAVELGCTMMRHHLPRALAALQTPRRNIVAFEGVVR